MSFHLSISLGSYRTLKSDVVREDIKNACLGKNDPLREDFENFIPKGFITSQIHVVCEFCEFGRPEIGKVVHYLPDKKNKDRIQNLSGPAADNIHGVPQISSKSVHFRRSYIRMRERPSNVPQSLCNTRRSFSFFTE